MNTGQKERITGINIANAGKIMLIQKNYFNRTTGFLKLRIEIFRRKVGIKNIKAEIGLIEL